MKTKLTNLLGITYPIIQGGMAWISEAKLAAAVSAAGGAGIIAAGGHDAKYVREQIRLAKQLTDKPFGVNVQLMAADKDEIVEVICEEKPAFVTLGAGNPVPYFEKFSKAQIKKIPVVPNAKLAKRVEDSGADAIVIEGMEAGGHIGILTTMSLMTQVIPLIQIPVIVGGGFADGRGLAAALIMGAAGVQMGTRFLIAEECNVHHRVKEKLLAAIDTDTVITGMMHGHGVRGLKNAFTEKYLTMERQGATEEELDKLAAGTNRLAAVEGDVEQGAVLAGQSLLPLKKIEPAATIIESIVSEATSILVNAPQLVD
ncbi:nitronate monooxygenase [Sporomusa acidovorans]|uniref:Probable nitronate monooxygenase n=1 Tax=Sporomusa acidovorans (strain ATCC 49682 / DSM 3132 / Mol) TaxID=1123286 RepID=A0ABZ3IX50_SPOA4|nr:nitronate monooxygenase [Sporomusa acidovorans]OZC13865.1 nitronate monooxygenase [Sporomusa acidovorans DSM 3132]SDF48391.1 enoyl-[acyl-carrier protein] reductase II [Sporomusa acidovorans]